MDVKGAAAKDSERNGFMSLKTWKNSILVIYWQKA